jgi:hypothetical protein
MSQMFLNVVSTFKGDGIQKATKQLGAFGKQTSSFGSMLGKVGGALAAFGVATKAVQFGRESITAARDLERNLFALNTVFDDLAPGMNQFAKDAENLGLSQSKAAKASVFIGSVLKQSGFAMNDVAKETKNLVTLGTDLAALYGYDVQEALLGMTALFRGEYDPIEKFGVAMKQSEINAELAARGQNKLEGAARRNAEQTIRLELLYQRANDAMGAFTAQSGSLYTEQKKLGATFENMQAQLGTALLPAVAGVNEELRKMLVEATPGLIDIFEGLAEVFEVLLGVFRDSMDPTTELGESIAAMQIQFDSLYTTLFGRDFNIAELFEAGAVGVNTIINFLHDLMRIVENTTIGFQVMGEQINLLLTGQFDKLINFDAAGEIKKRIDIKDTMKENKLATARYRAEFKKLRNEDGSSHRKAIKLTGKAWKIAKKALKEYVDLVNSSVDTSTLAGILRASRGSTGANDDPETDTDTGGGSGGGGGGETAAEKRARKEKAILDKRKAAFKSFNDAVKQTFSQFKETIMSSFDLPSLGNSINSITRNIGKLLQKTRNFASNITQLASMGLDPALLQQVIQAGPIAGAQLAAALVSGGAGAISGINASFAEFGSLASTIAGAGTGALFGTPQTVNNYSVNVTGGVATAADVGRAVVNAIRSFESQSGSAWRS